MAIVWCSGFDTYAPEKKMRPFKCMVQVPGPLEAVPRSLIREARMFVTLYDNPSLARRFRVVLKIDGRWYLIDKAPEFVTVKEEGVKLQWPLGVRGPVVVEAYSVLDPDMTCIAVSKTEAMMSIGCTLWCHYNLTR